MQRIAPGLAAAAGLQVAASATWLSCRMHYSVIVQDLGQLLLILVLVGLAIGWGWDLAGALGAVVVSCLLAFLALLVFLIQLFPDAFQLRQ